MKNSRWLPWVSVGSTLIILLFGLVAVLSVIAHFKQRAEQDLSTIEPRIARLEGLQGAGGEIGQALAEQKKQLDQLVYDSSGGLDRVGAELQQKTRSAITSAGLSVQGSQVFTPKPESRSSIGFIEVRLNVLGNLNELRKSLAALSTIRPRVYVTELSVQPVRRGNDEGDQQISATINVSAIYLVAL